MPCPLLIHPAHSPLQVFPKMRYQGARALRPQYSPCGPQRTPPPRLTPTLLKNETSSCIADSSFVFSLSACCLACPLAKSLVRYLVCSGMNAVPSLCSASERRTRSVASLRALCSWGVHFLPSSSQYQGWYIAIFGTVGNRPDWSGSGSAPRCFLRVCVVLHGMACCEARKGYCGVLSGVHCHYVAWLLLHFIAWHCSMKGGTAVSFLSH
jgi:hypothetical protein